MFWTGLFLGLFLGANLGIVISGLLISCKKRNEEIGSGLLRTLASPPQTQKAHP
jgi:hypothetical protein